MNIAASKSLFAARPIPPSARVACKRVPVRGVSLQNLPMAVACFALAGVRRVPGSPACSIATAKRGS